MHSKGDPVSHNTTEGTEFECLNPHPCRHAKGAEQSSSVEWHHLSLNLSESRDAAPQGLVPVLFHDCSPRYFGFSPRASVNCCLSHWPALWCTAEDHQHNAACSTLGLAKTTWQRKKKDTLSIFVLFFWLFIRKWSLIPGSCKRTFKQSFSRGNKFSQRGEKTPFEDNVGLKPTLNKLCGTPEQACTSRTAGWANPQRNWP